MHFDIHQQKDQMLHVKKFFNWRQIFKILKDFVEDYAR
jgi:hypothetical protein